MIYLRYKEGNMIEHNVMMICGTVDKCDNKHCEHRVDHEWSKDCDEICEIGGTTCVPVIDNTICTDDNKTVVEIIIELS
jgi:hypothetical protein